MCWCVQLRPGSDGSLQKLISFLPGSLRLYPHSAFALECCHAQSAGRPMTLVTARPLQVDDDAPMDEIKKAYRSLAKECHPDYLGDEGHNICILLNEAYEVRQATGLL